MLLASFLVSCDLLLDLIDLEGEQFYAQDFRTDRPYTLRAKKLAEGEKCVIWVENGSGIDEKKAKEFAAKFDKDIRPKIVGAFGMKNITDGGKNFNDILDYANWLAGKDDKKLTILLLDIKDNFKYPSSPSFVAGYFSSGNFYKKNQIPYSNECDMIYVDTYPSLDSNLVETEQTYATFAHELQHLINYATTTLKRKGSNGRLIPMDTWIDEGLSSQAEQIYLEKNLKDKCEQFSKDRYGTIAKGNNFFVWGNNPNAILDEYSTVYLFFRWLYLQAADKGLQSNIFIDIETSNLSDHNIIINVAKKINSNWTDWDTVLRSWFAANYNPANSVYGYKGDSYFQENVKLQPMKPTTPTSINLYPGEGVYSTINGSVTPQAGGVNIRYAGLSNGSFSNIVTQGPFNSNVLLTYNANTNNSKSTAPETGYLTGEKLPDVPVSVSSSGSRMVTEDAQPETHTRPYVIDARDYSKIFGRNK